MMHGLVSGQVKKESENVLELASHFKMFFFCPELERRSLELCRSNNNSSSSNKFSRLKFSNQTPKKICRSGFTFDKVGGLFGMSQQEFQLPRGWRRREEGERWRAAAAVSQIVTSQKWKFELSGENFEAFLLLLSFEQNVWEFFCVYFFKNISRTRTNWENWEGTGDDEFRNTFFSFFSLLLSQCNEQKEFDDDSELRRVSQQRQRQKRQRLESEAPWQLTSTLEEMVWVSCLRRLVPPPSAITASAVEKGGIKRGERKTFFKLSWLLNVCERKPCITLLCGGGGGDSRSR